jgi:hypothetical protein
MSLVLGARFPKLPRPTGKPSVRFRPAEKPLGYVIDPAMAALSGRQVAPPAKAAAYAPSRQTGGFGRMAAPVPAASTKAPQPVQYTKHYDKHGRETIRPEDIPF